MGTKGPGLKKARAKTIELPLAYVLASEGASNALAGLLDEGLSVENVREARRALEKASVAEKLLTREQRDALGLWE